MKATSWQTKKKSNKKELTDYTYSYIYARVWTFEIPNPLLTSGREPN